MGFVYVASNVCFDGIVKIGSCLNVENRMKTLSNASVPQSFHCEFFVQDSLFVKVELEAHKILESKRISKKQRVFQMFTRRSKTSNYRCSKCCVKTIFS